MDQGLRFSVSFSLLMPKLVFFPSKQEMQRKLEPNVKWISDFAIHSGGDNIIVGDYSTRLAWIDTGTTTLQRAFSIF